MIAVLFVCGGFFCIFRILYSNTSELNDKFLFNEQVSIQNNPNGDGGMSARLVVDERETTEMVINYLSSHHPSSHRYSYNVILQSSVNYVFLTTFGKTTIGITNCRCCRKKWFEIATRIWFATQTSTLLL